MRISQGAVVVLEAKTGAVRALIGGVGNPRAITAHTRAAADGSAIKPIVWLAGLRARMSPSDTVLDGPLPARLPPHDYEAGYHGEVSMTEALAELDEHRGHPHPAPRGGARRVIAVARSSA